METKGKKLRKRKGKLVKQREKGKEKWQKNLRENGKGTGKS